MFLLSLLVIFFIFKSSVNAKQETITGSFYLRVALALALLAFLHAGWHQSSSFDFYIFFYGDKLRHRICLMLSFVYGRLLHSHLLHLWVVTSSFHLIIFCSNRYLHLHIASHQFKTCRLLPPRLHSCHPPPHQSVSAWHLSSSFFLLPAECFIVWKQTHKADTLNQDGLKMTPEIV